MDDFIEINNCNCCRIFDKDIKKFKTDIFLHRGFWHESFEVDYSLQTIPKEEQVYFVSLSGPLKIKIGEEIWIYYDCPSAYYNGYSSISDICKIRYCFGRINKLNNLTENRVTIEFEILKTITLGDTLVNCKSFELQKEWIDLLYGFANNYSFGMSFSVEKIGEYFYVSCGSQGDLGQNLIIGKNDHELFACMVNQWSFHEDFIYGGKFKIPVQLKEIILDEIDTAYKVYCNKKLVVKLRDSYNYDTATPYNWCLNKLIEIKNLISSKSELIILGSGGRIFEMKNFEDFINWVKIEFKGGFEEDLK